MRVFVVASGAVHKVYGGEGAEFAAHQHAATLPGTKVIEHRVSGAELLMTFESAVAVRRALDDVTLEEFVRVVTRTVGATRDYAEACYSGYKLDPITYCGTRNPRSQGEALFRMALAKAEGRSP